MGDFLNGRIIKARRVGRLLEPQLVDEHLEPLPVFGDIDGVGACARIFTPAFSSGTERFKRRLAAELHDNAQRFFNLKDIEDIFGCHRLKIKPRGNIVIRADGFRVAVDHDGLIAHLLCRQCRVYAAVVEFDTLPDAVRPAAENHDTAFRLAVLRCPYSFSRLLLPSCLFSFCIFTLRTDNLCNNGTYSKISDRYSKETSLKQ